MADLKRILVDHLRARGMTDDHIAAYLKSLAKILADEPGIGSSALNARLHALGWDEVSLDYHFLEIARACLEAEVPFSASAGTKDPKP
jgi:hypothetical protein